MLRPYPYADIFNDMKADEQQPLATHSGAPSPCAARSASQTKPIPSLENGDRLTREEFERRFDATPGLKKAELIEGVVFMPAAVRWVQHGGPDFWIHKWLAFYQDATPGVQGGSDSSIRLDPRNEPQPDVVLFIDPACGGQLRVDEQGYLSGAPELAVEISSSSVSIDLHAKFEVYRRNGVREYLVWRVLDAEVDWFVLREDKYDRLKSGEAGILKSEVFPGLWLDAAALVRGDLKRVREVLGQGLASPEHAAFVARLQQSPSNPNG